MAKAKFKLGTMVKYQLDDDSEFLAEIVGVVTRSNRYEYIVSVDEGERTIDEDAVTGAYKSITPTKRSSARKPRAKKTAPGSPSEEKTE